MRLLIDTNIFLEVLLEQDRAAEALQFLTKTGEHEFFMSDFSLHSISARSAPISTTGTIWCGVCTNEESHESEYDGRSMAKGGLVYRQMS